LIDKDRKVSPLMNSDDTDRQKDWWKDKILNAARTRLPTSFECYVSAKIESHALDVEEPDRLTFLINLSLRLETF
jgi:hypothetical protein